MQAFLIVLGSVIVGGGLAGATIVGLVNSQTSSPSKSPTSVDNPVIQYGPAQ